MATRASRHDVADSACWWRHRSDIRFAVFELQKFVLHRVGAMTQTRLRLRTSGPPTGGNRSLGAAGNAVRWRTEANGARWPSRSSKSVAPRVCGGAGFDSQALPPAFASFIPRLARRGLSLDVPNARQAEAGASATQAIPRPDECETSTYAQRVARLNPSSTSARKRGVSDRSSNTTSAPLPASSRVEWPPVATPTAIAPAE